jgi:hypothetical protein
MEEIQLEPRDLSGASKLTLEGQTIVVHHKKNPTVFPLAAGQPPHEGQPHTSAFSVTPATTGSAWKMTRGMRQRSTSRVAALARYTVVIRVPGRGARVSNRTVQKTGWLLLGDDENPVAWLGSASASYGDSPLYDSEKAKEFAQRAGIGYVELGTMPYEFFQQKVEGIPRLGPGTGAVTAYVADSRQWLLAGIVVGGMIVCLPLLLHLTVVAPALNLLWILLFGLGGFLFGGIASIPLLRHYREHHSTGVLVGVGAFGALTLVAGLALVIPAAAAALNARAGEHSQANEVLESNGLWWKVAILGIGFLLSVMPWNARKAVAAVS